MEIINKIEGYFKLKEDIFQELSKINPKEVNDSLMNALITLLKDVAFESKAFEIMLHLNAEVAKEHLDKYYLTGEPRTKSRFKGNLDLMFDDYKNILGESEFKKLITRLSKNHLQYPIIEDAIEFANDN